MPHEIGAAGATWSLVRAGISWAACALGRLWSCGEGSLRRISMPRIDIPKEGVAIGNQRRVKSRLGFGVMSECGRVGRHLFGG